MHTKEVYSTWDRDVGCANVWCYRTMTVGAFYEVCNSPLFCGITSYPITDPLRLYIMLPTESSCLHQSHRPSVCPSVCQSVHGYQSRASKSCPSIVHEIWHTCAYWSCEDAHRKSGWYVQHWYWFYSIKHLRLVSLLLVQKYNIMMRYIVHLASCQGSFVWDPWSVT